MNVLPSSNGIALISMISTDDKTAFGPKVKRSVDSGSRKHKRIKNFFSGERYFVLKIFKSYRMSKKSLCPEYYS